MVSLNIPIKQFTAKRFATPRLLYTQAFLIWNHTLYDLDPSLLENTCSTITWCSLALVVNMLYCYNLSPYSWYLPVLFLPPHSYSFRYVFLWLGSLPDPFEFVQLCIHWTLTLCHFPSITTGQGNTSLLIAAYHFDSYLQTASLVLSDSIALVTCPRLLTMFLLVLWCSTLMCPLE